MKRLCIYSTIGDDTVQVPGRYVPYALRQYKAVVDRLVVVTDIPADHPRFDEINQLADLIVRSPGGSIRLSLEGYRLGFAAIAASELQTYDEIIFVDSACYGPIRAMGPILDDPERQSADFWSIGYAARKPPPHTTERDLGREMTLSLFSVSRRVAASREFQDFMRAERAVKQDLHLVLEGAGFKWHSFVQPNEVRTHEPMLYEAPELVRAGCPVVLKNVFSLDPLLADTLAIDGRAVLEAIKEKSADFDVAMIWESILPHYPLRMIQTNMDDLRVFESNSDEVPKGKWDFGGKIAVVAHVYYVDTLPEFFEIAGNIPCDFDFFISTSSEEHKQHIESDLRSFDCGGRKEVRVVEQNRGRDMSSLFITFRAEMLSGDYAWVLRLHSKRTPQMPWQIGQSFKMHLIENLAASRHFVKSLFDLLEKPDYHNVGVVAPPVVHIGFGTLGHSWFSNRGPLEKIAKELAINVPLDRDTPVATYGTMYWFRPTALEPMFRYNWKWEDYNAEPNHIDGGLAHVQERLICYCAQNQGFRTLAVMSTRQAERNYLKLEYKHQILAGRFPVRSIRQQYRLAAMVNWSRGMPWYSRLLDFLERMDGRFQQISPGLWKRSRAAVDFIWPMFKGLEK
jgi:rhamnosyltransferase